MSNLRQSMLVRTDLRFNVGLMAAQCAHIHMEKFRKKILASEANHNSVNGDSRIVHFTCEETEWLKDPYIFIHGVPNKEVLDHFINKAKASGIEVNTWTDCVYIDISDTQREAFPDVVVGVSLGPTDSDKIKAIIGDLPLLK